MIDPEYIALGVNATIMVCMLAERRWAQALYWFGTIIVVSGVIAMGGHSK